MADKKAVDTPRGTAEPLAPGDPVEHQSLSAMGATFAERKAAREKMVGSAENKQVASGESKGRRRK